MIGQVQDSVAKGSSVSFDYSTSADSTFGIGVSASPFTGYTASGTYTITNTIGGDGGFSEGPKFNRFVLGHFYRQKFKGNPQAACNPYEAYLVKAVSDAFPAPKKMRTPAKDPFGRCSRDPHGLATMAARTGHFSSDRSVAATISAAAMILDLSVSGSTGFTDGIHTAYQNHSKGQEYVCGNKQLPNAPKLWSNDSQGK